MGPGWIRFRLRRTRRAGLSSEEPLLDAKIRSCYARASDHIGHAKLGEVPLAQLGLGLGDSTVIGRLARKGLNVKTDPRACCWVGMLNKFFVPIASAGCCVESSA